MSAPKEITDVDKPTLSLDISQTVKEIDLHSNSSSNASDDDSTKQSTPCLVTLQSTASTLSSSSESLTPCSTPSGQPVVPKICAKDREQMARDYIAERGLGISYDNLDEDGKLRAKRLMTPDVTWSPSKDDSVDKRGSSSHEHTTFRNEFDTFCNSVAEGPEWKSRIFFDDSAMDEYLAIRQQRAGICFMHAGAILQHYLQCKRTTGPKNHTMLDLSTYIRESMSNDEVSKYLQKGGGGNSIDFFSLLTGIPKKNLYSISFPAKKSVDPVYFNDCATLVWNTYAQKREPGLVSSFYIERAFAGETLVFDYEVDEAEFDRHARSKEPGRTTRVVHSMVLIGAHREEKTGKVWFFLQNFWRNKYFRIVSAEYLASCQATISFAASHADVSLKGNHPTVDAMYVETDLELEECEECLLEEEEEEEWADYV